MNDVLDNYFDVYGIDISEEIIKNREFLEKKDFKAKLGILLNVKSRI